MSAFIEEFVSLIEASSVRRPMEDGQFLGKTQGTNFVTRSMCLGMSNNRPPDGIVGATVLQVPDVGG